MDDQLYTLYTPAHTNTEAQRQTTTGLHLRERHPRICIRADTCSFWNHVQLASEISPCGGSSRPPSTGTHFISTECFSPVQPGLQAAAKFCKCLASFKLETQPIHAASSTDAKTACKPGIESLRIAVCFLTLTFGQVQARVQR